MTKPLDLEELKKNIKKKIDISGIKCQFCNEEVEPEINVSGTYILSNHKHLIDNANFYSLWSCERHGSVPAILNGKTIDRPTDVMNMDIIKIDDDIFINIQRLKSACDFYLLFQDLDGMKELIIDVENGDIELNEKENKELYEFHLEYSKILEREKYNDLYDLEDRYNLWLFKLAFKDVYTTEDGQNSTSKENSKGDHPMKV
ncbi:MAG: hypothetical protein ACTSRP_12415 [Candidatus Helarchaeota archaeon]